MKNRLSDIESKLTVTKEGSDKLEEFEIKIYTVLYTKQIINKDLVYIAQGIMLNIL